MILSLLLMSVQMDAASFTSACLAGGGAPGTVTATGNRDIARETVIGRNVRGTVTVNNVDGDGHVYLYVDSDGNRLATGNSFGFAGNRIHFLSNENQNFQYCMRLR